jgi:TRAP-type C4-dicarboxylate transport system substrate-binding protein
MQTALRLPFLLIVLIALAGGLVATQRGSASPRADVVTLTFANSDGEFDAIPEVKRFVDRVKILSRGQLELNVISEWGQGKPGYERTVVKDIQRGKADLGWVGVRVLDTFGVKSFQALQAPMLIDSYPLQRAVLRSEMPATMLADLDPIGVVGLSLVANELRHPFATKAPLAKPADFKGKRVRVYSSEVQTLTMRALGAKPSYEGWADVRGALTIGELQGMESDLANYVHNEYASVAPFATVNVTLWPRTIALVANAKAFAALSSEQRGWLRQAADDATSYSLKLPNTDQKKLNAACRLGARAVIATPADLAKLSKALAPVYRTIQRDTKTKRFVRAIRVLKRNTRARPLTVPAGCAS